MKQCTLNELQKAKAMSLMCENYGCPILNVLARYVLQMPGRARFRPNWYTNSLLETDGVTMFEQNGWMYSSEDIIDRFVEPTEEVRRAMSEQYGISVADQLQIENDIICSTEYVFSPTLMKYCSFESFENYRSYVTAV
jgi:hypothetical protein